MVDPRRSQAAKKGWATRRANQQKNSARKPVVRPPRRRSFDASLTDTLLSRWVSQSLDFNSEIKQHLDVLRGRSQDLAKNNQYVARFLNLLVQNVIGPSGIRLQARATDLDGTLDTAGNEAVESAWQKWCRAASADRRFSWCVLTQLALRTVAVDGEIFFRKVRINGKFKLQPLLSKWIDERFEDPAKRIEMGIELDEFRSPVAYWLSVDPKTPGSQITPGGRKIRLPAKDVIHLFKPESPDQLRGIPWTTQVMRALKILDGYQEAELVAARTAAAKMGFLVSPTGDEFAGDARTEDGEIVMDAEPGSIHQLPQGIEFQSWNPEHPTNAFKDFVKVLLRSISSGLGVSYNTLASDLEGVNFSSIRQGVLDDRDSYRLLQNWLIETLLTPVYEEWLRHALNNGEISVGRSSMTFSEEKLEKFSDVYWQPRGWSWVDPVKDAQASLMEVQMGTKSLTEVATEHGRDFEETAQQLAKDKERLAELGLDDVLGALSRPVPPAADQPEEPEPRPQEDA